MSLIIWCFCSLEIQVIECNLTTMREKLKSSDWTMSSLRFFSKPPFGSPSLFMAAPSLHPFCVRCCRMSEEFGIVAGCRHFICGVWELEIISDPFVAALVWNGSIHQAEHSRKVQSTAEEIYPKHWCAAFWRGWNINKHSGKHLILCIFFWPIGGI